MINPIFSKMFAGLNDEELEGALDAARSERRRRDDAVLAAGKIPQMTGSEATTAQTSPIDAIKLYRNRTGCSLHFAKTVIDRFRERFTERSNG